METTTIQLKKETLERLKEHKKFPRESYDDLINSMMDEVEEPLDPEEIDEIKKGLDGIKKGNVKSIERVAKEMGVRL